MKYLKLTLLICLLGSFLNVNAQYSRLTDSLALLEIRDSILLGRVWNAEEPIEDWRGITLEDNRVVEIDLWGHTVTIIDPSGSTEPIGGLPKNMYQLDKLKLLSLSNVSTIKGKSMDFICGLKNLEFLYMSGLRLEGEIPYCVCEFENLKQLSLRGNVFDGDFPDCISDLDSLNRLDSSFSGEDLYRINPAICSLENLEFLWINRIGGNSVIPDCFCNLRKLNWLNLTNNNLIGPLPDCFFEMPELRDIYLGNNNFSGEIDERWANMKSLRHLALYENSITGEFPEVLCKMNGLFHLDLSENDLSGALPDCLPPRLRELYLDKNNFSGELKDIFRNLRFLFLANNNLSGNIPDFFGENKELEHLDLADNQFTGDLPKRISGMDELRSIQLQNNQLNICGGKELIHFCDSSLRVEADPSIFRGMDFEKFCLLNGASCFSSSTNSLALEESDFFLFSNPTNGGFAIHSKAKREKFKIAFIFDMQGKMVFQQNELSSFDISELKTGQYILKVISDDLMTTKRFFKN